ncbi:glutamate-cysteine ligase family protein [Salibacteraceae bacterium]|nr:glutamate-cysteine ligase family protein [Salibacteraceae bacterium]
MTGVFTSDLERGDIAWSNELVSHVIELKTNGPRASLKGLGDRFLEEVDFLNELLLKHDACLLPTGAHPFFKPEEETVIWPHEHNEVYHLYDQIFGCSGHGWSNLQSTHLNLPFANDEEFGKLHAAIRVLLPLIPAISASTPIIDGKLTGYFDTRLEYYRKNQQRIPSIAGLIIPEAVFTKAEYEEVIFNPIKRAIAPYDKEGVLDKHFLNSRGAIARFDRGAIEIRVIDIQECPRADIAIVEFIVAGLKWLTKTYDSQQDKLRNNCSTQELSSLLIEAGRFGSQTVVSNPSFLNLFGLSDEATMLEIWKTIFLKVEGQLSDSARVVIKIILEKGNLSERIFNRISADPSHDGIHSAYTELSSCLEKNQIFIP